MNRYLARYDSGYKLQENGEIWRTLPFGLDDLGHSQTGEPSIDSRVKHAIESYRRRSATVDQKRDAIKNLADVLESLRESDRLGVPKDEERRLFEIANRFGIRHLNSEQNTEYDLVIWLDWMFFSFLNAISLATATISRDTLADDEAVSVEDLPFE